MAATTITKTAGPSPYPATATEFLWTAGDVGNGNDVVLTGKDILLVWNSDGAVQRTFTITSQPDPYGRSQHITAQALDAGEFAIFGPVPLSGWADANRKLNLASSNAAIKFAVITLQY